MPETNTNIWFENNARILYIFTSFAVEWVLWENRVYKRAKMMLKQFFFLYNTFSSPNTTRSHTPERSHVFARDKTEKRELSRDESAVPPTACKRAVREWKSHSEEDEKFYLKFFLPPLCYDIATRSDSFDRHSRSPLYSCCLFFRRYRVGEFVDSAGRRWTLTSGFAKRVCDGRETEAKKMLIGNWIVMIKREIILFWTFFET